MLKRALYSTGEILPDGPFESYREAEANEKLPVASPIYLGLIFYADDLVTPVFLGSGQYAVFDAKLPDDLDAEDSIVSATFSPTPDSQNTYNAVSTTDTQLARDTVAGQVNPVILSGQYTVFAADGVTVLWRSERFPLYLDNVVRSGGEPLYPPASRLVVTDPATGMFAISYLPPSVVRNYAAEARAGVDSRLAGRTASATTMALLTSSTARNPALWAADLAPYLTCVSTACSVGSYGTGWSVTAITPRHVVSAAHVGNLAGATVTFLPADGTAPFTRTLGGQSVIAGDVALYPLDSDLPASIVPAALMPPLPSGFTFAGCPVAFVRQDGRLYVGEVNALKDTSTPPADSIVPAAASNRAAWTHAPNPAVMGDSTRPFFIIVGGRPVLLACFHDGNIPASDGPDVGAQASALATAIGGGYSLRIAALPEYPSADGGGSTGPDLALTGNLSVGGATSLDGGGFTTDGYGNASLGGIDFSGPLRAGGLPCIGADGSYYDTLGDKIIDGNTGNIDTPGTLSRGGVTVALTTDARFPASVTGLRYGNGSGADTAATGAQVAAVFGNVIPISGNNDSLVGSVYSGFTELRSDQGFQITSGNGSGISLRAYPSGGVFVGPAPSNPGPGSLTISGLFRPGSYTLSTLPSASSSAGAIAIVSNPASGKRGDVLSDGANWRYSDNSIAV